MKSLLATRSGSAVRARFVSSCLLALTFCGVARAADVRVNFDLPDAIECRAVTPPEFAVAHPSLKVIEAKFRVSARVDAGDLSDVVDFMYVVSSADRTFRVQDYLPNTTLESTVAEDQIEVTDGKENSSTLGGEAHVGYHVFNASALANHGTKDTHASHYKEIAARELVVASGTTDREHGVFYRLRPSRVASLEGAKEFTFLAIVAKNWRGDVCVISCNARARKSSLFSKTIEPAGGAAARIGLYLSGDSEAASLADDFRLAQERDAAAMKDIPPAESVFDTISHQTVGFFTHKTPDRHGRQSIEDSTSAVLTAQSRLKALAH